MWCESVAFSGSAEVLDIEELLGLLDALLGEGDGAVLFIDDESQSYWSCSSFVVGGGEDLLFQPRDEKSAISYSLDDSSPLPEMMSGVVPRR